MGLDLFHLIVISAALLLGFLSLFIGKSFIRRRDSMNAIDSLWYVALILVLSLAFSVFAYRWQSQDFQDQIDALQRRLDKYEESQ